LKLPCMACAILPAGKPESVYTSGDLRMFRP
jgi:hypothetical protein